MRSYPLPSGHRVARFDQTPCVIHKSWGALPVFQTNTDPSRWTIEGVGKDIRVL
jgi:hypothetical protein